MLQRGNRAVGPDDRPVMSADRRRVARGIRRWVDIQPSRSLVVLVCLLLTGAVWVGDYVTGPYLVFVSFYLAPVALAAWFAGRTTALLMAGLAAVAGVISTALDPQAVTPPIYLWNGVFRFITYGVVAIVVSAERHAVRTIHELASLDPLTGLLNRRRFHEQAEIEFARAKREEWHVAVVYVDVDDLKRRNDALGHEAGDAMLVQFASTAKTTFRTTDVLARVGGDEFCFLLPGAGGAAAEAVVERLRRRLVEEVDPPISFSAGIVSGLVTEHVDVEAVVRSADMLMLEAKSAGKARTLSASGLPPRLDG